MRIKTGFLKGVFWVTLFAFSSFSHAQEKKDDFIYSMIKAMKYSMVPDGNVRFSIDPKDREGMEIFFRMLSRLSHKDPCLRISIHNVRNSFIISGALTIWKNYCMRNCDNRTYSNGVRHIIRNYRVFDQLPRNENELKRIKDVLFEMQFDKTWRKTVSNFLLQFEQLINKPLKVVKESPVYKQFKVYERTSPFERGLRSYVAFSGLSSLIPLTFNEKREIEKHISNHVKLCR